MHGVKLSVTGFSPGTAVSPTNKTYRHNITELLLKVTLNTINLPPPPLTIMLSVVLFLQCCIRPPDINQLYCFALKRLTNKLIKPCLFKMSVSAYG